MEIKNALKLSEPLVLSIFYCSCQLRDVITFERVISLCLNFQDNLISYILSMCKSFIRICDGSCNNLDILVHLTWNEPISKNPGSNYSQKLLGLNLQPNFQKGGTWQDLNFLRGVAGKEGVSFFREGCNFHIKKIKIWHI